MASMDPQLESIDVQDVHSPQIWVLTLSMVSIQESDFSMQWATLNLKKTYVSIFKGQNTIYIYIYIYTYMKIYTI